MQVSGKGNEGTEDPGYEVFDSSEFEESRSTAKEDASADAEEKAPEADAEDKKVPVKDDDRLTPEEAFGDDKEADGKEASDADTETPAKEDEGDSKPAYEPNFKYKVYDQEKEFPESLRAVVKDKESEDYVRDLLTKADGLEGMKVRHQDVVRERDAAASQVEFYKNDINRVLQLRDKNPLVFAQELGLSDDWIIKRAKEIVTAKETPEAWRDFSEQRARVYDQYNAQQQLAGQQQEAARHQVEIVRQGLQLAFSHPDVSSFQQRFDAVNGLGEFQKAVQRHGYLHYEMHKVNLPPMDAVKAVMDHYGKMLPAQAAHVAPPAGSTATPEAKPKPKALPNIGTGRNVSPTGKRFKSIKEMREYVDKHVPG